MGPELRRGLGLWAKALERGFVAHKARVASAESGGLEDVSIWNASLFQCVHICQFVLSSSPCLEVTEAASVKALNTELGSIVCTQLFSPSLLYTEQQIHLQMR